MSLFDTGVRPVVDAWLLEKAKEKRDYGDYWSASSAGYCQRKLIFERLGVPPVVKDGDARKQRVFTSGHLFHAWIQSITKEAGISVAQELELQDEDLMVRGHFDDLVLVREDGIYEEDGMAVKDETQHLILYDYKTQNSKNFATYAARPSHYHKMQLGTYMYMLRKRTDFLEQPDSKGFAKLHDLARELTEARILKISKDDLRLAEVQYLWSEALEKEVVSYWTTLNGYWKAKTIPKCTCANYEGGFMAKEAFNPYFYEGEPCSMEWYKLHKGGEG